MDGQSAVRRRRVAASDMPLETFPAPDEGKSGAPPFTVRSQELHGAHIREPTVGVGGRSQLAD
eukprot:1472405-Pleurochrysis_carterae.AAC.4